MPVEITFSQPAVPYFPAREFQGQMGQGFERAIERAKREPGLRAELARRAVAELPMALALEHCRQSEIYTLRTQLRSVSGQINLAGQSAYAFELRKKSSALTAKITQLESQSRRFSQRIAASQAAGVLSERLVASIKSGVRYRYVTR